MKRYCRNCFHPLPYKAKYCSHCGQRDTDGRIGMKSLMLRLWNNTFHLEGKFIRTAWQLFVPAKVTIEFFKGKQDRYPHPIRLFAIVMFLFLFLFNIMLKNQEDKKNGSLFTETTTIKNPDDSDTIVKERSISVYEQMKYDAMLYDLRKDYEKLPADWRTGLAKEAVDSVLRSFSIRYNLEKEGSLDSLVQGQQDSSGFGLDGVQIATLDIVRYEPDEIIERYHVTGWLNQMIIRQGIKSYKTPDALVHAYIGSLTWTILALIAIMSGVLALLYWRQRRYYVEHFIFLLHFHIGVLLSLVIVVAGRNLGLFSKYVVMWAMILPAGAFYIALLRYYKQGPGKTFVKWFLYGMAYFIAFVISFVLGLAVVFAMY